jgi:hypothetical protein
MGDVEGRENKFVFAGERAARRNARAEKLALAAIEFEEFGRTGKDLLANGGAKANWVREIFNIGYE